MNDVIDTGVLHSSKLLISHIKNSVSDDHRIRVLRCNNS